MKRLCKYCKWWEQKTKVRPPSDPLSALPARGHCSNEQVNAKVSFDEAIDSSLVAESFGCNFWEKRDEEDM